MKIPGLDDAMSRLDNFQRDMIPLLQQIADNTPTMTAALNETKEMIERLAELFGIDEEKGDD